MSFQSQNPESVNGSKNLPVKPSERRGNVKYEKDVWVRGGKQVQVFKKVTISSLANKRQASSEHHLSETQDTAQ